MRSLGISIQPDGFTFALCDGSLKKYSVAASGGENLTSISDDPVRDLGRSLGAALKSAGALKFDRLIVSAPSVDTALREHSMPFIDREKVMQVLKFEIESELYHIDIDEVVCDYIELHDDRATSTLMVGAMPKPSIQTCLDVLTDAGIDTSTMDVDYGGLAAATQLLPKLSADEELDGYQALLWIGPFTSILMVHGSRGVRSTRTLHIGYRDLARELALETSGELVKHDEHATDAADEAERHAADSAEAVAQEALDELADQEEEAEDVLPELPFGVGEAPANNLPLAQLLEAAGPEQLAAFRARLAAEIRRGLLASSLQPVGMHMIGAAIPGLDEQLQQRLDFPVERFEFENGAGGIALGNAYRGLGDKSSPMNFRQEEFRFTKGLERVQGPVTFALTCLLFYFVLNGVVNFKRGHALMSASASLEENRSSLLKIVSSDVDRVLNDNMHEFAPDDWRVRTNFEGLGLDREFHINSLHSKVKAQSVKLDEMFGTGTTEMPQSCLNAWNLLFEALHKELDDKGFRWMVESLSLESMDKKSKSEAHVECKLGITILDDQVSSATRIGELLEAALRDKEWVIGVPSNAGWGPPDEGVGSTTILTLQIDTKKARELEEREEDRS
jgi:Tfp pilus assembly PilM family ATPase